MSAPDAEKKQGDGKGEAEEEAGPKCGGEVLFCGGTNWESMGRRSVPVTGNLLSPTRLRPLMGVDIRFVASGCTSCHCVALDVEGRCYTWGRNEKGQLGHGDTLQRNLPTIVAELSKYRIVRAGAGRNHTVVVTEDGKSFAFGGNKHGQLGTGSTRNEFESSPVACMVSQATNAVCGADFTLWLSSVEGSSILTAGLPQYGQLGHGTENQYNARDSSIRLVYEPQPRPRAVAAFSEKTVVKVACGTNHTVAVDSSGFVYTWGFGGYGRLGHREQKDEWVPRLVEVFQKQNVLPPTAIVSAGSVSSACTAGGGQLYMWGKLKNTGDDWMYPKPVMDLSGWNIHCMDSGNMHHVIGADESCISWGVAQYGELGYGPLGQKSSANPKKVDILEGMHVTSVACGMGLSLIVVDRVNIGDRLDQLEVYDGDVLAEENADHSSMWRWGKKLGDREGDAEKELATSIKRTPKKRATDSSAKTRKKKKRSSSESDDECGASDDSKDANHGAENIKRGRGGKVSGGGRGRKSKNALTVKSSRQGRGRSKSNENSSGRGRSRPNTEEKTSGRGHGRARAGKKAKVSR